MELVVVVVLLGALAAVALPRFLDVTDDARLNAAKSMTAAFEEGVGLLHGQWRVADQPATLTLQGTTVEFDGNGWPTSAAAGNARCIEIWQAVYHNAEPVVPFVGGAAPDAWGALSFGTLCLYVYQYGKAFTLAEPLPFFIYQPLADGFNILRFNMT